MKPLPSRTLAAIPLFPLPNYFLFGGAVVPLQVFETRYRQMMADLMDGPGRLVVAPFDPEAERGPAGPPLARYGTLAEIVRHEELADGRWIVLLLALDRVELTEAESDRLYRRVDAEILPEPAVGGEAAPVLRERLTAALSEGNEEQVEPAADLPLGRLADLLLHRLQLEPERAQVAYEERSPTARAAMALAWHDLQDLPAED